MNSSGTKYDPINIRKINEKSKEDKMYVFIIATSIDVNKWSILPYFLNSPQLYRSLDLKSFLCHVPVPKECL